MNLVKRLGLAGVAGFAIASAFGIPAIATGGHGDHKVVICHKDHHTIEVDKHAVKAHLKHGDYLGECRPEPTPEPTTPPPTEEPTPTPTEPTPTDPPTTPPTDPPTEEPEPTDPPTTEPSDDPTEEAPREERRTPETERGYDGDQLPLTGPNSGAIAGVGLGLVALGATALYLRRRFS